MGTYRQRNILLSKLGFDSYKEYLESDLWKSIRLRVLTRDSHKCRVCNRHAHTVHHINYSKVTLSGVDLDGVVSICEVCHDGLEFDLRSKDKKKLTLAATTEKTKRWLATKGKRSGSKPWIGLHFKARHKK